MTLKIYFNVINNGFFIAHSLIVFLFILHFLTYSYHTKCAFFALIFY